MLNLTNPLDLIPPQYTLLAKGIAILLAVIIVFSTGWTVNGWRKDVKYQSLIAEQAQIETERLNNAIKERDEAQSKINAVDEQLTKERSHANAQIADLRKRLSDGTIRLSIPSNCVPQANNPNSCNGKERTTLDRATGESLVGITEYGDQSIIQLTACQNILKSLK